MFILSQEIRVGVDTDDHGALSPKATKLRAEKHPKSTDLLRGSLSVGRVARHQGQGKIRARATHNEETGRRKTDAPVVKLQGRAHAVRPNPYFNPELAFDVARPPAEETMRRPATGPAPALL